jgi:hypothetical protein
MPATKRGTAHASQQSQYSLEDVVMGYDSSEDSSDGVVSFKIPDLFDTNRAIPYLDNPKSNLCNICQEIEAEYAQISGMIPMDRPRYLEWQERRVQHLQEHGHAPKAVDVVEVSKTVKDHDAMENDGPAAGTHQDLDMSDLFDFDKYEGKTTPEQRDNKVLTSAQSKKRQAGPPLEPLVHMSRKGRTFQTPPLHSLRPLLPKPVLETATTQHGAQSPIAQRGPQALDWVPLEKKKSRPRRKPQARTPLDPGRAFYPPPMSSLHPLLPKTALDSQDADMSKEFTATAQCSPKAADSADSEKVKPKESTLQEDRTFQTPPSGSMRPWEL